jgi:L-iditol 2-dehydrogenase
MANKENVAIVLKNLRNFELEAVPYPKPGPRNVVVRMATVGICGSDVHYFAHGKCGPFEVKGPLVLGHESSGVIEEVGEGVTNLKVGDRVAIEPGVPCRYCNFCRSGKYNLCPDVQFLATPPVNGSLTRYMEHAADFCYKLPDNVSLDEGALLEPLSVAVHACTRSHVGPGTGVLITGAGPIGLVCLLVARACGATTIVVTDVKEDRLELAKKLGATAAYRADDPNVVQNVRKHAPLNVSMECSGAEPAIALAIRGTDRGGKLVSIGRSAKNNLSIPLFEAADNEIDIIGSFRYHDCYPKALALVASGAVNVKPLITHRFPLAKSKDAFELAESGSLRLLPQWVVDFIQS